MVLSVMRIAFRQQKWAQLSTIPDQELITFIFDKYHPGPGFGVVNKREILVNGRIYDVVRKADNGKTITYRCVYDHKEQSLITKTRLLNSKAQQLPLKNTARLIVEKIIKTAIVDSKSEWISESRCIPLFYFDLICYSGPPIQILLPPPQSCC
jgi:hypothetical protein